MPRCIRTVKVSFLAGEFTRAHVESWSEGDKPHLVDLASHYPLGECSCRDWQCRRLPEWRKTLKSVRCRHLEAAREALLNRILREHAGLNSKDGG